MRSKHRTLGLLLCLLGVLLVFHYNIGVNQYERADLKLLKFPSIGYMDDYDFLIEDPHIFSKDINERCQLYFNSLYERKPQWQLHEQIDSVYDAGNPELFEFIHHYNIYNHCFLKSGKISSHSYKELVVAQGRDDLDERAYPWLTRKLPIFLDSSGSINVGPSKSKNMDNKIPIHAEKLDYNLASLMSSIQSVSSDIPFWSSYNKLSKGRGIIITLGDKHLNLGIKLLRNLRILGTKLPVQIIHHGELNPLSKLKLLQEATTDEVLYDDILFKELRKNEHYYTSFDRTFSKLDITFIDTVSSIKKHYLFEKYNRKFLAILFNTFEEFIFVDVDAVLFKKPEQFFETTQYKASKSLFFKDRNLVSQRESYFNPFFDKAIPNYIDNKLFGIPILKSLIKEEEYFKLNHVDYMESGVVCMDKIKFFPGILMSAFLSMKKPMIEATTGDKELFWLGQLISGETEFSFNDYWAASTGDLSAGREGLKSKEVCSTHPSHISSDTNELMWINTGAFHCRDYDTEDFKNDFKQMSARYPKKIKNVQDMESYYKSAVTFEYILFPPENADLLELPIDLEGEPRYGFMVSTCCRGYMWCAYDQIGFGENELERGLLLKVPEKDQLFYNYIANSYILDSGSVGQVVQ